MIGSRLKGGIEALERRRVHDAAPRDAGSHAGVEALRCACGRLLARVLRSAVELKCARCKRVVILVGGKRFEEAGAARCECLEDCLEVATEK